ncbi:MULTISPECIES: hypothetical protein [unclassified Candidatus Frackibacter]|uniref:hypothetical protein n=1 Tax=unclassified Candidatus Frackibacter TaxID=2648818 RepID=UPI00088D00F8|nr:MULTISPECIES: hypothetical protein [unclassified Candidatus Frackibacter]SDC60262.1 hypothetical protein SAMN04515661_11559 [Candidatus Frackibacter sp. WG11]SEM41740.1 hypothetical protein SAMN04488698_10397 [Candidatus Frackibacter sp. WG12]SFL84314.1 hypothetical protein SAMN04488699_1163 [Candidatus Frackibacter sp. WG13]
MNIVIIGAMLAIGFFGWIYFVINWLQEEDERKERTFKTKDKSKKVENNGLKGIDEFYFDRSDLCSSDSLYIYNKYGEIVAYVNINEYAKEGIFNNSYCNMIIYESNNKESKIIEIKFLKDNCTWFSQIYELIDSKGKLIGRFKYKLIKRRVCLFYDSKKELRLKAKLKDSFLFDLMGNRPDWITQSKEFEIYRKDKMLLAELEKVKIKTQKDKMYCLNIISGTRDTIKEEVILSLALILNLRFPKSILLN